MTHNYTIHGMTCNGCRSHVEKVLNEVEGVTAAKVDLEKAEAVIEMDSHVPLSKFQAALKEDGGTYSITLPGEQAPEKKTPVAKNNPPKGKGTYYCPMHCEGDKTYDKPGNCPICGMDLVPMAMDSGDDESTYKKLSKKFKVALAFTLPIFIIAMSEKIGRAS